MTWRHEPVGYHFLNPSSGGVYRFAGVAAGDRGRSEWRLILKVTRSADAVESVPTLAPKLAARLRDTVRWDRELLAYETGFLGELDGELAAPAMHGGERLDDTSWIWLDDLGEAPDEPWPLPVWGVVGHALGTFNGDYLAGRPLPAHDWLGRGWLRVWATEVTPRLFPGSDGPGPAWEQPSVEAAYPPELRARLWSLWADRERLLHAVEALPRTCCHLDAHRRNLFLRGDRVVAIDWGMLGLAAAGEELAATLVGTVGSGEVAAEQAPALVATLYDGYLAGLRDAGWRGDERELRVGFTAAAALRALSVLRLDAMDDPGLDDDEAAVVLACAAEFTAFLATLGDEARELIRG